MRLEHSVICFGVALQVRSLLLRDSQPNTSQPNNSSGAALASSDADAMDFSLGSAGDLLEPADDVYDATPAQSSYQWSAPTLDASNDGSDDGSLIVAPVSETNDASIGSNAEGLTDQGGDDALIGSNAQGLTDQGGDAVAPATAESVSVNLNAAALAWLHTPKAGTSFANVLIAWGCPRLLGQMHADRHVAIANKFCLAHKQDCPTAHSLCKSHSPINFKIEIAEAAHSWKRSKGHFVGMFRNPEQRHISGFYDDQLMSTYGVEVYHGFYDNVLDYAKANAGCSTKLLVGKPCNDKYNATEFMVDRAAEHLEAGFAFVGLTEEWALSVCLFHKMFGGECDVPEFGNLRLGSDRENDTYSTAELGGWMDPFDGPLYERAKVIFWSNVVKFNVSSEICKNTVCPKAAQYF